MKRPITTPNKKSPLRHFDMLSASQAQGPMFSLLNKTS